MWYRMHFVMLVWLLLPMSFSEASHQDHAQESEAVAALGAQDASQASVVVEPQQAVVEVYGVVCSFCAYGIEKKLNPLTFLDHSKFNRGVLIDIDAHRITLALASDKSVDLAAIHQAITDAGYDPIRVHLRVAGVLVPRGKAYALQVASTGQTFMLQGDGLDALAGREHADVQGHVEMQDVTKLEPGVPISLTVDHLVEDS